MDLISGYKPLCGLRVGKHVTHTKEVYLYPIGLIILTRPLAINDESQAEPEQDEVPNLYVPDDDDDDDDDDRGKNYGMFNKKTTSNNKNRVKVR